MKSSMRTGPHPLSVHLGMVASNMVDDPFMNQNKVLSVKDAEAVIRGIGVYQKHTYKRPSLPTQAIWSSGVTSVMEPVLGDSSVDLNKAPLLFVPSLINKSYILDINEDKSFVRWMKKNGSPSYIIDWGDINLEQNINIEDIIIKKLNDAIIFIAKRHSSPVNMLGYCMGGVLTLGALAHRQDEIGDIVLLATPFDFCDPNASLYKNIRITAPNILSHIHGTGQLPSSWIQSAFASLDPAASARKFIEFSKLKQNEPDAEFFVAVEDWLNDGIDLPCNVADHCMHSWFINNALVKNEWMVSNRHLDLSHIQKNILIVASQKDRIVPASCSFAASKTLQKSNATLLELNCGHISLVVGRRATQDVWRPIRDWLK